MMQPKIKTAHTKCPGCSTEFVTGIDVSDVVTSELQETKEQLAAAKAAASKGDGPAFPSWVPRVACANGSCTGKHDAPTYTQRVTKKCANGDCGQFAPVKAVKCQWCDSKDEDGKDVPIDERFDDMDEETLDDLHIPRPQVHSHDH